MPSPGFRDEHQKMKALTVREVYEVLRDTALGVLAVRRLSTQTWSEIYCGMMTIEVEGWVITLYNDCNSLDYCDSCYSPDGRSYDYSSPLNQGTDPVELLSSTEHELMEARLNVA